MPARTALEAPDPDLDRVIDLAARVRRAPGDFPGVAALGKAAGIGSTPLRLLFLRHYHTTPAAFLERARLDAVCRNLLSGRRPLLDLALEAGWENTATFQDRFRRSTGLTPEVYRKLAKKREFVLQLPAGYRPEATLRYLGRDPESRAERVQGTAFAKAVRLAGRPALLTVEIGKGMARCRIESVETLPPEAGAAAHAAALRLLGLQLDPGLFERQVQKSPDLAPLIAGRQGLRLPLSAEIFEGLVWAIVGQQVNLTFAATLRRRVAELYAEPLGPEAGGLLAPPSPEAVARLDPADLAARQFSRRKAEYLIGTAQAIVSGQLPLDRLSEEPATVVERRLLALRGLGPWTAQYVMLRACGFADCVPVGDSGLAAGLVRFFALDHRPGPEETRERLTVFAPYRSLATAHLWASLGSAP
ncbi:MAG TPA: helix-turn-helix domain-containing protein [Thermoanaerobaculia bacterium]|nr:helix-turn-helix domain-containing protein [Thermoanaerobaculia bacterium]